MTTRQTQKLPTFEHEPTAEAPAILGPLAPLPLRHGRPAIYIPQTARPLQMAKVAGQGLDPARATFEPAWPNRRARKSGAERANALQIRQQKRRLGVNLFRLALELSREGVLDPRELRQRIKGLPRRRKVIGGSRSVAAAVSAVAEVAELIRGARRIARRLKWSVPRGAGNLPKGSLRSRWAACLSDLVLDAFRTAEFKLETNGTVTRKVTWTADPAAVTAVAHTYTEWEKPYRPNRQNRSKTGLDLRITVTRNYLSQVWRQDLEVVDGLPTIDAERIDCPEPGIELYRATWVERSRGCSMRVEHGFIARSRGVSYHGATVSVALQGIRRKLGMTQPRALSKQTRIKMQQGKVEAFIRRHAGKQIMVTLEDAYETGACEAGVRSWCHANHLPYEKGQAPLDAILEAYRRDPMPEARRAILYAVQLAE